MLPSALVPRQARATRANVFAFITQAAAFHGRATVQQVREHGEGWWRAEGVQEAAGAAGAAARAAPTDADAAGVKFGVDARLVVVCTNRRLGAPVC